MIREAYADAAAFFVATVARIKGDRSGFDAQPKKP